MARPNDLQESPDGISNGDFDTGFSHMNHTDESVAELLTLTLTVDEAGTRRYRNSAGELHRIHGPAVTYTDGSEKWFLGGRRHRTNGPAVVYPHGFNSWYLYGELMSKAELKKKVAEMCTTL